MNQKCYPTRLSFLVGTPSLFKKQLFSHTTLLSVLSQHLDDVAYAAVHHQWLSVVINSLPHVITHPHTAEVLQTVIVKVCTLFDHINRDLSREGHRYVEG